MSEIRPIELTERDKEYFAMADQMMNGDKLFELICQMFMVPNELVEQHRGEQRQGWSLPDYSPLIGYSPLAGMAKWVDAEESITQSRWEQMRLLAPDEGNESEETPKPDHVV